ncbi:hypothetical protein C5U48_02650 [Mycolicibacter virginiensis]|uniref:DUF732 domain-containing protein n=1 Tax=Mycolicibacter virginiensis TaxID=1795032 RepID=A0A9X7IRA3_9MYCO|nr:hypothetical protein [Mycolicibacter virginiensis]PQM53728.1 hypothetical protein C5U48_02650 [Mycolicibacter virginiensis]
MKIVLTMATVLSAAVLLGAPPAMADARQDFLDQYHARGAYQVISDEMLMYWGTKYCHDKADGNGEWWQTHPSSMKFSPSVVAEIADQTLCP